MSHSTTTRTRMTRLALRWIGTRVATHPALLRACPACTAQLGQSRPRAHAAAEWLI
jgi:hypothetical protein